MVKNAVIVPVGAKGGFVVKQPPAERPRRRCTREGIACYRIFIAGLLDLTDNLVGDGGSCRRRGVVRHDGDDPYLVVAADKGTATFSDIANGVAAGYGFWLGDAFASGGSVGYDHKAMGITARGAWEAVQPALPRDGHRHPDRGLHRRRGRRHVAATCSATACCSREHIQLVAAFDHRHIFLDPDPDAAALVRRAPAAVRPAAVQSWADYDPALIGTGGGVFTRHAEVASRHRSRCAARWALDANVTETTPPELMRAILRAPVDLLWNGGIGTYVKAASETDADVGDRANDAVRVDGDELRAKVIGEGGNLGVTQLGRIEFARAGGRINTDAIDNSAGVDCSDHEVNIKILLDAAGAAPASSPPASATALLASMTDEVARLVLADNSDQNDSPGDSAGQRGGIARRA